MVEKFGRVMVLLFIGALIMAVSVPFLFMLLLSGEIQWIGPVIAGTFSIWLLFLFSDIGLYKKRNGKKMAAGLISFCTLIGISFAIPHYYKESFAKVADGDVDLFEYQPFTGSGKLASLDGASGFKISSEIPMMDGATALYPLYAAFAQSVYPEGEYNPHYESPVVSSTTPEAYRRLIAGEADIIFAAGPSIGQKREAESAGVELEMTPIGREAFVFFVNSRNSLDGLSSEEIRKIYSGELVNWQEVGGNDDEIRPFQRPEDSGSQTTFIKFMDKTPIQEPEVEEMASGMGGMITEVASYRNYKNAIGYTFRFYSTGMVRNDKIKLLAVDGIEPTIETIRSGEYPLTSEFYAITAGTDNPNVQPFIDWILSEQGQELVEKTGYVSVK